MFPGIQKRSINIQTIPIPSVNPLMPIVPFMQRCAKILILI